MPATAMLHEKLAGEGDPVLLDATTIDAAYAESVQAQCDADAAAAAEDGTAAGGAAQPSNSALTLMRAAPGRRFSDAFHQYVRLCVDREPARRPTAAQLLSHPFLVRQCRRAPPLSHLLRPDVPVSEATLLEGGSTQCPGRVIVTSSWRVETCVGYLLTCQNHSSCSSSYQNVFHSFMGLRWSCAKRRYRKFYCLTQPMIIASIDK